MGMNKFIHESRGEVMKFTVWFCEFSAVKDAKPTVRSLKPRKCQCVFVDCSSLSAYRTSLPVLIDLKKKKKSNGHRFTTAEL